MIFRQLVVSVAIATLLLQGVTLQPALADEPVAGAAGGEVDPATVSRRDQSQAKKFARAGEVLVGKRQYPEAIEKFEQARKLHPLSKYVYNLAVTYQLNEQRDKAIEHYRRYLEVDPQGIAAADARRFLTTLEAEAAEEQARKDAAEKLERERRESAERAAASEREVAKLKQDLAAAEARAEKAAQARGPRSVGGGSTRGETLRLAGVGATVAGLAGLASGGYFVARSARLSRELSKTNAIYSPDKVADGESADRAAAVSFIAGGVLVISGITMYVLGRRQGAEAPRAALAPVVQPGGGAVVLTGGW